MRRATRLVPIIVALSLLACGLFLRFHDLDRMGLSGSDAIYYTEIAHLWSQGITDYQIGESITVYRPAALYLYALAIKVLGFQDDSIKTLNATIDTLNIVLVFLACYLAARNVWPAASAALCYAMFPVQIFNSRTELVHTVSSFMVLSSVVLFSLFLVSSERSKKVIFLLLSGTFVGFASLSHQELLALAGGFVIFMVLSGWQNLKTVALEVCLFSLAAILVSFRMVLHSLEHPYRHLMVTSPASWDAILGFPEKCGRLLWNSVLASSSSFVLVLFILVLGTSVFHASFKSRVKPFSKLRVPDNVALLLTLVCFQIAFSAFFVRVYPPRVFLPLMPLVLMAVVLWSWELMERLAPKMKEIVIASLAVLIIVFNVGSFPGHPSRANSSFSERWNPLGAGLDVLGGVTTMKSHYFGQRPSKIWYELLRGHVHDEAKLLVASSLMLPFPGRRVLQVDYYLGDNALMMIDHKEPLDPLIRDFKVKYVLLSTYFDHEPFLRRKRYGRYTYGGRWVQEDLTLGAPYGFEKGEYSVEREFSFLIDYLDARGADAKFFGGNVKASNVTERSALVEALLKPGFGFVVYEL